MSSRRCPKCKDGMMRQQGFDSCNWRCELCGYKEYVPRPPKVNTYQTRADINSTMQDVHRASADADAARRAMRQAASSMHSSRSSGKKGKSKSGGGLGTFGMFMLGFIVVYILMKIL